MLHGKSHDTELLPNHSKPLICNQSSKSSLGKQGWHSGVSTRLPPVWPKFDSQTWDHMWAEFVFTWFSTLLQGFFSGYSGFLSSAKTSTQSIQADCWLCFKVTYGHSGCQKAPRYAFGPTLSSCVLAILARTISESDSIIIVLH